MQAPDKNSLGRRVAQTRTALGLTQAELAQRIKAPVSRAYIRRLEGTGDTADNPRRAAVIQWLERNTHLGGQ